MVDLTIKNIKGREAREICNDFFGELEWSKEQSAIRAYPDPEVCEIRNSDYVDPRIAELEDVRATFKKVLLSIFQDGGLRHERLAQAGEALEKSDLLDD